LKAFRSILFWLHLAAGLSAGVSIAIMCFTGATLAFESEIVAWTERAVRRVDPPAADAPRLSLDELQKRVRVVSPDSRPISLAISADRGAAVAFSTGRDTALYANPYTGEIKSAPTPNKVHDFLNTMEDWHRVLAMGGDQRAVGKAINGACNLAFFVLAVSGLYLWWPRSWSLRSLKAVAIFNFKAQGKARDFNWHNSIGLWCAPVLIVLTLTAVPMSYRWGANLIYKLTGEAVPAAQQGPGGGGPGAGGGAPSVEVTRPSEDARPLGYDALFAAVQTAAPHAELITFRLGGGFGGRGGNRGQGGAGQPGGERRRDGANAAGGEHTPAPERPAGERRLTTPAVTASVKLPGAWPRMAMTTLTLNPYTGEVLKREGYEDLSGARRIRSWTRFLHTGQALGWIGQLIAGLACLGGCFLVYTGFALSWRRFFFKKAMRPVAAKVTAEISGSRDIHR
jgi:uncharacterized iron-regulated membrane protein